MENLKDFTRQLKSLVNHSNSFLLIPHVNPDGDALGTMLAFYGYLNSLGKNTALYSNDDIPRIYKFLPGIDKIEDKIPTNEFDCVVLFECPNYCRSPLGDNFKSKKIVNIDHHPDNDMYGDLNYVDTTASSVGEIFYGIFRLLDYRISFEDALNLYVAIYTDTGGFNYSNTTYKTHMIISEILKEHKLDLDDISRKVYREVDFNVLKLLGKLIDKVKIHDKGISTAVLTQKMMDDYGVGGGDVQNFIREIFQIRGVHTLALLRDSSKGKIKVSFRSYLLPVNKIAARFCGGGHPRASGCKMDGYDDIYQAEKEVLKAMEETYDSGERLP